jgi:outer membrane receptor protein involved in Fe transport
MRTEYTDLQLGADRLSGNEMISAPKARFNAALDYRRPLDGVGVFEASLGGSVQGRQWYSAYNGAPGYEKIGQGGYGVLNVRTALADGAGKYRLALAVSNALDRHYDNYAINLGGFGFNYFMQGAPRRVSLSLSVLN